MRTITLEDKKYLIQKLIHNLRALPSYNPKLNGLKAEYVPRINLMLSCPVQLHLPVTPYQFNKLITTTFKTHGYEASGLVVYMTYIPRKKGDKTHLRKTLNVIIRRLKRLE